MMRWYVLQTRPGEECSAAEKLKLNGYQTMLPMTVRKIRSGGVWRDQETLLIPGYVTVRTAYDAENYYRIKELSEILRFVGNGAESYLSYTETEWLRLLSQNSPIGPSRIRRLEDGSFEVMDGMLRFFPKGSISIVPRERKAAVRIKLCGEEKQVVLPVEMEDGADEPQEQEAGENIKTTKADG